LARHARDTWFDWLIARFKQPKTRGVLLVILFVALFIVSYNYFSSRQEQGFRIVERSELTEPDTDLLYEGPDEEGASALTEEAPDDVDLGQVEDGTTGTPAMPETEEPDAAEVLAQLTPPVAGKLVRGVGWYYSELLNEWRYNAGVDIEAPEKTEVKAALAGTVSSIEYLEGIGVTMDVTHPSGIVATYGGLANLTVNVGDSVEAAQTIGQVGPPVLSEGSSSRLHFELAVSGEMIDPEEILGK